MLLLDRLRDAAAEAWWQYERNKDKVYDAGDCHRCAARSEHRVGYYHGLRDAYLMAGGRMDDLNTRIEAWEVTR